MHERWEPFELTPRQRARLRPDIIPDAFERFLSALPPEGREIFVLLSAREPDMIRLREVAPSMVDGETLTEEEIAQLEDAAREEPSLRELAARARRERRLKPMSPPGMFRIGVPGHPELEQLFAASLRHGSGFSPDDPQ
jgi:hypothetical protein